MKTIETSQTQSLGSGIPRRTLVKGAAWSVPVIAAAVATPLAAATVTTCPDITRYWGNYHYSLFEHLSFSGQWQRGSTGIARVGFGHGVGAGRPAFGVATPTGTPLSVNVTALAYTYTLAFAVDWTTIPAGWALTSSTGSAGAYTYTFTYTAGPTARTITATGAPGTAIVPYALASGTIIPSSIPLGTSAEGVPIRTYTASINATYVPTFSAPYVGCKSPNADDRQSTVFTGSQTLVRPSNPGSVG